MLERLPDHPTVTAPAPFAGPDHPMRTLTRAVAFDAAWTSQDADRVAGLFDGLAPDWSSDHVDDTKAAPVRDALDRGRTPNAGRWLEVGSGTGAGTRVLAERGVRAIATDLSTEMLRHAPRDAAPQVQADAALLPFPAGAFDAVLLVNMLLFPSEIDRVLHRAGTVVWVNTLGDQTPIHLSPDDLLAALPGAWRGITSQAGTGFWVTARRS